MNSSNKCTNCEAIEPITETCGVVNYGTEEYYSVVSSAILDNKLNELKLIFKDTTLVNLPLTNTGHLAGYTPLHLTCMLNRRKVVKLLVENYHADVSLPADDGAQPIHLTCFYGDGDVVDILLRAGANVDAEAGRDLLSKCFENFAWNEDFVDKMTILTFATLYKQMNYLAVRLVSAGANLKVKSSKNKTLLMYAIEKGHYSVGSIMAQTVQDQEFINARDDDGFTAVHYLLHPMKFAIGDFERYYYEEWRLGGVLDVLLSAGADVSATVNGDPNTLLLNMAAYRSCTSMLKVLLLHYDFVMGSKALYHASSQLEESRTHLNETPTEANLQWRMLHEQRQDSLELILKDLVNRRTFGLFVPTGEKELMDLLIAKVPSIRKLVHNYEKCFIQGQLMTKVIQYGDKTVTFFDFVLQCFNNAKIRLLVENKSLIEAFRKSFPEEGDFQFFKEIISLKIERAGRRNELLGELKQTVQLRAAIPVPYELVLYLIEYLNDDLEKFIKSFNLSDIL